MKILISLLFLFTFDVSIAEQIETIDRNDLKDHQSEYFKQLEREEARLLGIIELNTDAGTKDRTLAALGVLYSQNKAFKKAEYYLRQVGDSAKNNKNSPVVSASRYNLAMLYLHGKGEVEKSLDKAFNYFAKAAEAGNTEAMREVYIMCRDKEVSVDKLRHFTSKQLKIADLLEENQDHDIAIHNLQILYLCDSEREYLQEVLGVEE